MCKLSKSFLATVPKPVFSVAGTYDFGKSMVFSFAGRNGASGDSSKTIAFLLGEDMRISKTTKRITFLATSTCGDAVDFCFELRELGNTHVGHLTLSGDNIGKYVYSELVSASYYDSKASLKN